MTIRDIYEDLRTYIMSLNNQYKVLFDFSLIDKDAKSNLIIIDDKSPDYTAYFDGDFDGEAYIYVHHTDLLSCIELKETLSNLLDDYCTTFYRILTINDEDEFKGIVPNSNLKVRRFKIKILYGVE